MANEWDLGDLDFSEDSDIHVEERDSNIAPTRIVPANMVALAQKSWDEKKTITLSFRGKPVEMVRDFAETMKFAGDHTTPPTTVKVADREDDSIVVEFTATARRGRKPGDKAPKATENGTPGESIPESPKGGQTPKK